MTLVIRHIFVNVSAPSLALVSMFPKYSTQAATRPSPSIFYAYLVRMRFFRTALTREAIVRIPETKQKMMSMDLYVPLVVIVSKGGELYRVRQGAHYSELRFHLLPVNKHEWPVI